jgi:hypothetical protein
LAGVIVDGAFVKRMPVPKFLPDHPDIAQLLLDCLNRLVAARRLKKGQRDGEYLYLTLAM